MILIIYRKIWYLMSNENSCCVFDLNYVLILSVFNIHMHV